MSEHHPDRNRTARSMRSPFDDRSARIWLVGIATMLLAVSVAGADEVELAGGDVLRGTVVEQTDTHVVLEHSALGRLEIARDQITSLVIDTPPAGEGRGAAPEKAEKKPEMAGKKEDKKWKSHVNLAFNGSFGNSDTQSLRVGGRSVRKTPDTRLRLDAVYYISTSDGERDDNDLTLGILHDWLISESPWFYFAQLRYDYDQFESWEQRIAAHTGPGYHLIAKEAFDLDLRAGIGPRKEFGSQDEDWKPEGLLGFDLEWEVTKRQSFDFNSTFFPIVSDLDDYRTRTTAHWVLKLTDDSDLSVTAGLTHEYQSVVDPGREKNDTKIFTGLQFGF